MDIEHERAVKNDKVKQFARDLELAHYNVSAKTGEMVIKLRLFVSLLSMAILFAA